MNVKSIEGNRVSLEFASFEHKKLIYNFLTSPQVIHQMFDKEHPPLSWEEFKEESNHLYSGEPNEYGSYLLIKVDNQFIGSISYTLLNGTKKCAELDIWISSTNNIGKGFGTEALNLLMEFVRKHYSVSAFIIRPWIKNTNAIKAYKKCGFREIINFNPIDFYSEEEAKKYGEGDYGISETVNMSFQL